MKVGEYARLNNTLYNTVVILKIMEVYDNTILTENDGSIFQGEYGKDEIINHSYNIIDLIEVGDYVDGLKVINIVERLHGHKDIVMTNGKFQWATSNDDYDIKSIVTKEQFEEVAYHV